jgi:hypothetical protein
MARLIPLFERAGVRVVFSGHEHNFQHARTGGIHYFVTGAAGKLRLGTPDRFEDAHTQSWSAACHFLLARIEGDQMAVRAIAERGDTAGLTDLVRYDTSGAVVTSPMVVRR